VELKSNRHLFEPLSEIALPPGSTVPRFHAGVCVHKFVKAIALGTVATTVMLVDAACSDGTTKIEAAIAHANTRAIGYRARENLAGFFVVTALVSARGCYS
jgi:hypothetical protein